jgi:hypothetical protein
MKKQTKLNKIGLNLLSTFVHNVGILLTIVEYCTTLNILCRILSTVAKVSA